MQHMVRFCIKPAKLWEKNDAIDTFFLYNLLKATSSKQVRSRKREH